MTHHFLGSGHGKGEHDGAGVVIKRHLTQEQLKPHFRKLQCAEDVVFFLRETMCDGVVATYASKVRLVTRVFWEVDESDVDRSKTWACKSGDGTRGLNCVSSYSLTNGIALRCRQLPFFCISCMQGLWKRCSRKSHVKNWEYVTLEPSKDVTNDNKVDNFAYKRTP